MAPTQFFSSLLGASTCLRAARCANPKTLASATRTFSSLPTLRPTLLQSTRPSIFRAPNQTTSIFTPTSLEAADLVPTSAITLNTGVLGQIRCGPRFLNMQRASRLIQKRRAGFLSRLRTKNGRKTLERRKAKGRKRLSA